MFSLHKMATPSLLKVILHMHQPIDYLTLNSWSNRIYLIPSNVRF